MTTPLTGLYVPGDRPDRFEKAVASGADLVVFDLEDAVSPVRKAMARTETVGWLRAHAHECAPVLQVRINAGDDEDLEALAGVPETVEVRIPKVTGPADLAAVRARVGSRPLTALIESAAGVVALQAIAGYGGVNRLALGEADLVAELGPAGPVVDHARIALVFAAAAVGLEPPMLSVYPRIDDDEGLTADTRDGAAMGFGGRMAVHPRQLGPIRDAFRPSDADIAWAGDVLAATAEGGVHRTTAGDMVDDAMRRRALRILSQDAHRRA